MKNHVTEMDTTFGPHLMLDLIGVEITKLSDIELHRTFLKEMPVHIDMTPISELVLFHYTGLVSEDSGITGFQIIATSHISIHSFEKKGYCFIDIFSCQHFDTDKAIEYINQLFQPKKIEINLCRRGLDFPR